MLWLLILVVLSKPSFGQKEIRPFYFQFAPNYSFSQVTKNHDLIHAGVDNLPIFGLGAGYLWPLRNNIFINPSLHYQGHYYRVNNAYLQSN